MRIGRIRHVLALALAACLLAGACEGAGGTSQANGPSARSATAPAGRPAAPRVRLVRVATLVQPLAMAIRTGDRALYVAEKGGRVMAIRGGRVAPDPVLDISGDVSLGAEQGLLGLAFSPDGHFLYANHTDTLGDTHVTEFAMEGGRADPSSRREVLFVHQPYSNHNGGHLVFGPDGYLYIGLGDGGSGGDPLGNAQSLSTLLGKMLRISPRPADGRSYGIPADNPFVGRSAARPEIWAYGLRNPWRYSFDRLTGDLWIGDVGQSSWEEVDLQPAGSAGGENYGWNPMEGSHTYAGARIPPGAVLPVFEYSHEGGACAITGGHAYRGTAIPDLYGAYVFADFCSGGLEAIRLEDGRATWHRFLGPVVANLASFGEDASGELYALSLSGAVYRLAPSQS